MDWVESKFLPPLMVSPAGDGHVKKAKSTALTAVFMMETVIL